MIINRVVRVVISLGLLLTLIVSRIDIILSRAEPYTFGSYYAACFLILILLVLYLITDIT